MNDDLKNKINELKKQGYGYKKIAQELGITLSKVRYAYSKINEDYLLYGTCKNCGLRIKSVKGKKKKNYCSDKCRWKWWNKYRSEVNKNEK